MSDDKKNVGKQDDIRVDEKDPSEVEFLHRKYPNLSHEKIRQVIREFGPLRQNIEKELTRIK